MSAIEPPPLSPMLRLAFSAFPREGSGAAIFLDRDGVINEVIVDGYVTCWSEFRFVPGIIETLAELSVLGLPMIIVSNQAAVEKGILAPRDLADITRRFVARLNEEGARIDAVYYCPHTPEQACECRKPREALLRKAADDWRVDLTRSVLIGDSRSDMDAARATNCKAILLDRAGSMRAETAGAAITISSIVELATCVRARLRDVVQ